MEMESSRRPFDRSREPGLKKPRLNEDPVGLDRNTNGRSGSFIQRPTASGSAGSRFRGSERGGDSESSDSVRGPYPQTQQHQELVNQYRTALAELTFNSKPIITNLTIIAGESLHAAKAIASTVCANIIEVPREQKLPSLYLLDSIVKNIGRDYIKYFAGKLPEVFCKAYKQVDPSIHPGMRHLFGTWKGVFPLQTLQAIEKELGFVPTANGSSSGSRPDASVARPAHSIHVNPKYLEARRLQQQSTRGKGAASDIGGNILSSSNHLERLERTPSISSGRTWVDPSVKNAQHPQRGHLSDPVHEKKVNVAYGDSEYDANISRRSDLEIGRIGEKFKQHDKPWFEPGNVSGTISNQKNGFDIKHGFQSYPSLRSANSATTKPPASNFGSSIGMTESWKNSEEEEFMWEDVNSRLIDHGATNSSGRDHWTPDDSERMSEASADSFSTELRGQTTFGSQLSSSWSKDPNISDGNRHPVPARNNSGYSESYPASLGSLSTTASGRTSFQSKVGSGNVGTPGYGLSTNSTLGPAVSIGQQHQKLGGVSPSVQSPLHQHPSSPSTALYSSNQVVQNLPELDQPKVRTRSDPRISQFSGSLNVDPRAKLNQDSLQLLPRNSQLANQRLQPSDIHSSVTQSQLRRPVSFSPQLEAEPLGSQLSLQKPLLPQPAHAISTNSFLDDENLLPVQSSGQSSTSSLLAAVMNSGILGGDSATGRLPLLSSQESVAVTSKENKQPASIHTASLGTKIANSLTDQSSQKRISGTLSSQRNAELTVLSAGLPSSSLAAGASADSSNATSASTPVSSLLTTLVAKGLISASKAESPASITHQAPAQLVNESPETANSSPTQVSVSVSSSGETSEVPYTRSGSKSSDLPPTTGSDIKSQIGFDFKPDVLRELHPEVIKELLDDLPHKCNTCGLRLKFEDKLARHLEWHDLRNQNKNNLNKVSREWYAHSKTWIAGCGGFQSSDESPGPGKRLECNEPMVPADESQCLCILCGELFEDFYDQETDQWMFRGAVYATSPIFSKEEGGGSDVVDQGFVVHATCISVS